MGRRRKNTQNQQQEPKDVFHKTVVSGRTKNQKEYIKAIQANKMTICVGPAGTGKTYIASALALLGMKDGLYDRVIITRPMVTAGEETGFLPGDIESKLKPYLRPIYDEMRLFIDMGTIKQWLQEEKIEIVPYAFMRGRNFHNSFIIADEAQNATKAQLKMLVSRFGQNSKLVLTGDFTQSDLDRRDSGGLEWVINSIIPRMIAKDSPVEVISLGKCDIVREQLVEDFIEAIEEEEYYEQKTQESTRS